MRKILITGCDGNLGMELQKQLNNANERIMTTNHKQLDISNENCVWNFILDYKPDIVINCAAFTYVDRCETERDLCYRVNVEGPLYLSRACERIGSSIVHISTDYVFDGTGKQPKIETDVANPINYYGKSKLASELNVVENNPKHYIIRTAWLYGTGKNFIKSILNKAETQSTIEVVFDQVGTPTNVVDLSRTIIEIQNSDQYGIYHASCEGSCSWAELAIKTRDYLHKSFEVIPIKSECLNQIAKRPSYSVLENHRLKTNGFSQMRHWENAVEEYLFDFSQVL